MATKAQIQANIDAKLASGQAGGITAAQHRGAIKDDAISILNEMYNTSTVTDTEASTNILTFDSSDWSYNLNFKKQGGVVYVHGSITNNSASGRGSSTISDITNSEYIPNEDAVLITDKGNSGIDSPSDFVALSSVKFTSSGQFRVDNVIQGNTTSVNTVYINGFYFVGA